MSDKAKSIFDLEEFSPYKKAWNNRQTELSRRASYYDGSIYEQGLGGLGILGPRLKQSIEPLYLPLSRAVDIDAGIIPGGWKLPENDPKSEAWRKAIDTVFDWSNWDTDGVLYIHYGSLYGPVGLRISDLRAENKIIIQPIDPLLFMLIGMRAYDSTPDMSIMVEKREDITGETFEYSEIVTAELIRTFANATPTGFDGRDPEYKNELGFVPYVEIRHKETGKSFGECTFQKSTIMLDAVNKQASRLSEIIGKNTDVQWAIFGAEPSDLMAGGNTAWFLPAGADVKPLVPGVDIDGVLAFIDRIAANVEKSLPELAFDELRSKTEIATATLELQLMELNLKIKRTRPNYDKGLKLALQMAGRAAKTMGLSEISVLDDPELRFDPERNVLPVNEEDLIQLEMMRLELETMRTAAGANEGTNA